MALSVTLFSVTDVTNESAIINGQVTGIEGDWKTIVDQLLISKFRLYNASRQAISANVKSQDNPLVPMSLYVDSKQANKPFYLVSYQYHLNTDIYEIKLVEYDNTTEINLT